MSYSRNQPKLREKTSGRKLCGSRTLSREVLWEEIKRYKITKPIALYRVGLPDWILETPTTGRGSGHCLTEAGVGGKQAHSPFSQLCAASVVAEQLPLDTHELSSDSQPKCHWPRTLPHLRSGFFGLGGGSEVHTSPYPGIAQLLQKLKGTVGSMTAREKKLNGS